MSAQAGAARGRRAVFWLAFVACSAAAPLVFAPARAQTDASRLRRVDVLDTVVLPAALPGGQRLREVSGLAWDVHAHQLVTVSDRGLVVRWMLDIDRRRLVSAWPVHAQRLLPAGRVNAESIEVLPAPPGQPASASRLLVADEAGHRVLVADWRGAAGAAPELPLPGPPPATAGRLANDGIEAIAWHPRHGLLAVRQHGLAADRQADVHRVVAADGRHWALRATPGGRASVKALHLVDDTRLLVLEKLTGGGQRRMLLRELDLRACASDAPCEAAAAEIDRRTFDADDNFEGLACLDASLCLIASDDGRHAQPRTVLALLWLERGRRPQAP
ncbi:MAG: esterase-like activity of phytase family protein [Rubrivivax sp.]|nr:esterase-like activity of phytase family protein [Rubrivivax sp.]